MSMLLWLSNQAGWGRCSAQRKHKQSTENGQGDEAISGETILKLILKWWYMRTWIKVSRAGCEPEQVSKKNDNKPLGSIQQWEIITYLRDC